MAKASPSLNDQVSFDFPPLYSRARANH